MKDIILTESQKGAIDKACDWYGYESDEQQVFRIYGYAGVGKTEIIRWLIGELGLEMREVKFAAYTGKAAHVMHGKGLEASTIHQLIYHYVPASEFDINRAEKLVAECKADYQEARSVTKKQIAKERLVEAQKELNELKQPQFRLNEESELYEAKLCVLDECSMIDRQTAKDLMSFNRPIILLGDPGQLPPIDDDPSGGFAFAPPDVFLDEIHRQAMDSAIIRLATMARKGEPIPVGRYSPTVHKIPKKSLPADLITGFDQVICGYNRTRLHLNNGMRNALGYKEVLPVGPEEKIIALRNDHTIGVMNGQFVSVSGAIVRDDTAFLTELMLDDRIMKQAVCYSGYFLDHQQYDKTRNDRDWRVKRHLVELDFGYTITCHKAQGSGWENIVVVDDGWNIGGMHNRWLYTACTRAETGLVLM